MNDPIGNTDITPDDRLWAALGYPIAIIPIIMLLMEEKKQRPFIRFHAVQSLAFNIVLWVIVFVLTFISFGLIGCLTPFVWLVTFWPAYVAYQGQYQELPFITKFIRDQGWV